MINSQNSQIIDFLIAGTMKSGTSTLNRHLYHHPEVCIPPNEIHFFNRNFEKGVDWYISEIRKHKKPTSKIYGEKTPNYAWEDWIPEKLYSMNPNLKLIWLFRDPLDRIVSHYKHNLKSGLEWRSLEEALKKEQYRIKNNLQYGYLECSLYYKQVHRFLNFFPLSQMHFIQFEEFTSKPSEHVRAVESFLNLTHVEFKETGIINEAGYVKSPLSMFIVRSIFGRHNRIWNKVYQLNNTNQEFNPKFSKDLKRWASSYIIDDLVKLKSITSLEIETWKNFQSCIA